MGRSSLASGGGFPVRKHGKTWSLPLGSDKDFVAEIPGGSIVHVTTNDEDFATQCKTVGLLYKTALQLRIDQNTKAVSPSSVGR